MAKSFWDHLDELRSVLLKSLGVWAVAFVGAFCCKDRLFEWLFAPTQPDFITYRWLNAFNCQLSTFNCQLSTVNYQFINTELTAPFVIHLQVAMAAGLVMAMPFIVYWLYGFVSPALYERERRYSTVLVLASVLLFGLGIALNYLLIFPVSFRFLGTYQVTPLVVNHISLSSYVSLFLILTLLMGLLFEVPLLTWTLSKIGLLRKEQLCRYRRHVFVGILILAAVITPTGDPFTLMLVTLPVYLLYELSIALIR